MSRAGLSGTLPAAAAVALAALAALAAATPARAAAEPFDPSAGALLVGKERQPGRGKTPISLHLGADGGAAAALVDPNPQAVGWIGSWTLEDGELTVDLLPAFGSGDPITVTLLLTPKGGRGTVLRGGAEPVEGPVSVRVLWPVLKPRGWTAVVPRLRDTGGADAGDIRGSLAIRSLALPSKKRRPLRLKAIAISPEGMPGVPSGIEVPAGETRRLEGDALPVFPVGADQDAFQVAVTGGRGFDPVQSDVLAVEEVLRGAVDPSASGTSLPVAWARPFSRKDLEDRETAPLAVPYFRDDGGAGALPRDAVLVLRDLSIVTGDPAPGEARISIRTLDGAEVASSVVTIPRGGSVEVVPLDLLADPGDLPGGEGQIRVTDAGGLDLRQGVLACAMVSTVYSSGVPVASLSPVVGSPEPGGRAARLAAPWVYALSGGGASTRISVTSLSPPARSLPVSVLRLDGTSVFTSAVTLDPGHTVRIDPEALGMNLALLTGGEGQVVAGPQGGLPVEQLMADAETSVAGSPDTFFSWRVLFETGSATGAAVRVSLSDAGDTPGSEAGDLDAWLLLRNGGAASASFEIRAALEDGVPLGSGAAPVNVAAGVSRRMTVEEALGLLGLPAGDFRGSLDLFVTAGGPLAVHGMQLRRGAGSFGGHAAPVSVR
jgi:hypothetical protein